MKLKPVFILAVVIAGIAVNVSCSKDNESNGESKISQADGTESHNAGQNCMNCHKPGGPGEGQFNVAGTVYNSRLTATQANVVVNLYTQANGGGTLRLTLNGDAKGNFYTTANVDFTGGLYPVITGSTGNKKYMMQSVTTGACGSCHGASIAKIGID